MLNLEEDRPVIEVDSVSSSTKKNVIRILHVDDDLCILEVSKQILIMENNFDIENASSVVEAIRKMKEKIYDAIISDYEMPNKNGLDFLKELREQNNQIPFILFTGKGREDVAAKALNLGADCYVNKNGSVETVYCELADAINKTVERKKSIKLLAASESKYRTLVENSLQGLLILQASPLKIVFGNAAIENIMGYSIAELMSLSPREITELVYHEDRITYFGRLEGRLRGEQPKSCFEFRAVRKDGSIIWLEALSNRIEYDGQLAIQGMFLDITESKKEREILQESEQRYRELANSLQEIVFETNLTGKIIFFSQKSHEISGFTQEDLEKGINMLSFVVPEERERAKENMKKSMAGKTDKKAEGAREYTLLRKNGSTYPALVKTNPIFSANKVIGLRGLVIDITDRKKIEQALIQEKNKFESVIAASGAGLVIVGKDYHVLWANDFIKRYKGDTMGKLCYATLNNLDKPCTDCGVAKVFAGKTTLDSHEYHSTDVNGNPYWVEIVATPIKDSNGSITSAVEIAVDITERKHAEEALKESENRARAVVANSPLGIATSGADKHFLTANKAFCRILGYTEEELRNLTFKDITFSEDLMASVKNMTELEKGMISSFTFEKRYVKKQGTLIEGKIMVNALRNHEGKPSLYVAELEDITQRKKTEKRREALERKVKNHTDHLKRTVDLRTAELKTANERLVKSERLAAIGELAGMVGHDLRNPLTGIKNAAYYLKKKGTSISEEQTKEMLETIDKCVDRSDKIINDLLDYSREMHLELTKYNASALIDEAARMVQVPERIQIVNHVSQETFIRVNADKMIRVFTNIIKNAFDAMPQNGMLEIRSAQYRN
ncbi:MAG: PAS domain S-box protein [Candidatus Bathyarchaeia archaeon]